MSVPDAKGIRPTGTSELVLWIILLDPFLFVRQFLPFLCLFSLNLCTQLLYFCGVILLSYG